MVSFSSTAASLIAAVSGAPVAHRSMVGCTSRAQSTRPYRWCISHRPFSSPGVAIAIPPAHDVGAAWVGGWVGRGHWMSCFRWNDNNDSNDDNKNDDDQANVSKMIIMLLLMMTTTTMRIVH